MLCKHRLEQELPTYGAKLIGCRECTLDLHGAPRLRTWTKLAEPALANATSICLQHRVDWPVGSAIIISSTSFWEGYSSPSETEEATISNLTADGYCVSLEAPLMFEHLAETRRTAGPEPTYTLYFIHCRKSDRTLYIVGPLDQSHPTAACSVTSARLRSGRKSRY